MALPRNEQGPQRLRSEPPFDNLHLENSFEENGVSGQQVLDLLALEDDVFPRCLSAQPARRALQRSKVLTSCATSLQLICPLTVRSSATARFYSQVVVIR